MDGDGAAQQLHDLAADGQAHPGAWAGAVQPLEHAEDALAVLGRNALAVVADVQLQGAVGVAASGHGDGDVGPATMADGVLDQVGQQLAEADRVADDGRQQLDGEPCRRVGGGSLVHDGTGHVAEVDLDRLGAGPAGPGQLDQVVDEPLHVQGPVEDALDIAPALVTEGLAVVELEVLQVPEQRHHRALEVVGSAVDQRLQLGVGPLQLAVDRGQGLVGLLALGDVADDTGEHHPVGRLPHADGQLDRELAAVGPQGGQLHDLAGQLGLAGVADAGDACLVQLPQPLGDDHGQGLAEDLLGAPAEHLLGAAVPGAQQPVAAGRDDGVLGRGGDLAEALLGLAQRLVGLLALDQGAELAGDPGDAFEAPGLPGPVVGDEELQDGDQAGGGGDGDGQGLLDAGPPGRAGPVEAGRVAHVGEQVGLAGGRGQAGQAGPALVAQVLAGRPELVEAVAGVVPGRAGDQDVAGRQPDLAHGAAGEVADGLHGRGQDGVRVLGLPDDLEQELEEAALLLAADDVGAVAHHGQGDLGAAPAIAQQRQVPGAPDQLAVVQAHAAGVDLVPVQALPEELDQGLATKVDVGRVGQ
jgi:hypothetical protein